MNKKNFILIGFVLALAVVYVVFFTRWFRPATIQVSHTMRALGGSRAFAAGHPAFSLGDYYEITEIKVVALDANKKPLAQPVWHLEGDSDSINRFIYGQSIDGMDPVVEGSRAAPLTPGVTYRLYVRAGSASGQNDFQAGPSASQ